MVFLGGQAVSYERGTPVAARYAGAPETCAAGGRGFSSFSFSPSGPSGFCEVSASFAVGDSACAQGYRFLMSEVPLQEGWTVLAQNHHLKPA